MGKKSDPEAITKLCPLKSWSRMLEVRLDFRIMLKFKRLFAPLTRGANLREITSIEEYEAALAQELAVIFKHSKYAT